MSHITNQGNSGGGQRPMGWRPTLRGVLKNMIFILSGAEKLLQGSVMKTR